MKKIVRTVWISIVSGLALLVACTTPKGLSRAEKKQLKAERAELIALIEQQSGVMSDNPKEQLGIRQYELELRERLHVIDNKLGIEEGVAENDEKMGVISHEMDSLRKAILRPSSQPHPCVYGPPPR